MGSRHENKSNKSTLNQKVIFRKFLCLGVIFNASDLKLSEINGGKRGQERAEERVRTPAALGNNLTDRLRRQTWSLTFHCLPPGLTSIGGYGPQGGRGANSNISAHFILLSKKTTRGWWSDGGESLYFVLISADSKQI